MKIHKNDLHKEEDFRNWLTEQENMTRKCVNDVVSRCKRIQTEFQVDIAGAVKTEESYILLFNEIKNRTLENNPSLKSPPQVYGVLRRAFRLYAKFMNGNKVDYPKGHLKKS